MIKVAIISPIPLLEQYSMPDVDESGYHLLLSNLFGSKAYVDFYSGRKSAGDFLILDNSAHELGQGEGFTEMAKKIHKVIPDEVVVPDRLFMGEDTIDNAAEFIPRFRQKYGTEIGLMGVPQGRTIEEWDTCAGMLLQLGCTSIGISKDYEVWSGGLIGRYLVIDRISREFDMVVPVHMLGWGRELGQIADFNTYHFDGLVTNSGAWIRGVDSAKPLVYAASGIKLPTSHSVPPPIYPKRPVDFFSLTNEDIRPDLAVHNIGVMRTWAQN